MLAVYTVYLPGECTRLFAHLTDCALLATLTFETGSEPGRPSVPIVFPSADPDHCPTPTVV